MQDEVSEECGREERGPTQDEEWQEEPASASSSSEEQFVPVVVENIDLSTKDAAKSLVWDPTDIQFSDRSWELKADDLGPYQLLPVKFLLPDLYLDNLEGVDLEEGDQARSWPGGSGGPDPPWTFEGDFSESCKSGDFLWGVGVGGVTV